MDNSKYSNLYNYCGIPNLKLNYSIKVKLKKFFGLRSDFNLYIILTSILITIIIIFMIIFFIYIKAKRNTFIIVKEEKQKNNVFKGFNNINISVDTNKYFII